MNAKYIREKKVHPSVLLSSQLKRRGWMKHIAEHTASVPTSAHVWQPAAADSLTTSYQETSFSRHQLQWQKTRPLGNTMFK